MVDVDVDVLVGAAMVGCESFLGVVEECVGSFVVGLPFMPKRRGGESNKFILIIVWTGWKRMVWSAWNWYQLTERK